MAFFREDFDERTHAFLIGAFYRSLKETHGERGKSCFIKAAQRMAEQRGARMALRAMRDGYPLNYNAYMAYSEVSFTLPSKKEFLGAPPDYEIRIHSCPWHEMFREMDLLECGAAYCPEIDRGIVRGFNPDLRFRLESTLYTAPYCEMVFENAALDGSVPTCSKGVKGWDYHCGHVYSIFRMHIREIFEDAESILRKTDALFEKQFGSHALEVLHSAVGTDYNQP